MNELTLPAGVEQLAKHLAALRNARRDRQAQQRKAQDLTNRPHRPRFLPCGGITVSGCFADDKNR
jgi:hypothetical protein